MRLPQEWQEEDLLQLIKEKHEESIELDFKRADALAKTDGSKKEISKDISAFANSAGGTVVYGIAESDDDPHYAESLTPIDPKEFSKEWLENVINSRIQPRIPTPVINPVRMDQSASGKVAYVVVIPQSDTGHQASDKRYYKRFNFQSVPMEDYEVRQTMSRASRPAYRIRLEEEIRRSEEESHKTRFHVILENVSDMVGHEVSAILLLPKVLVQEPDEFQIDIGAVPYFRIAGSYSQLSVSPGTAIPSAHPFVPYTIDFLKSVRIPTDFYVREQLVLIVKVFDSFGLALTVKFRFAVAARKLVVLEEHLGASRSQSSLFNEPA